MAESKRQVHYIHRMSYTRQERLVGAFVLLAFAVMLGLLVVNNKTTGIFERTVTYHAVLRSAEGLGRDTIVRISGLEVGRVSDISFTGDNRIQVSFTVRERYRELIRADSKAAIGKLSVIGKSTIEITAGSPAAKVLPNDTVLVIAEPVSMEEMIAELTPVVKSVKNTLERVAAITQEIDPKRVNNTLVNIDKTASNMRAITDDLAGSRTVANLDRTLAEASRRLAELEPILKDAKGITGDTRQVTGELPRLVNETTELAAQLRVTAGTLNGQLQEVPDLVSRMKVLMDQTERTMDTITHTWPLSAAAPPPAPVVLEVQQVK